jgi:hypothetical protein
MAAAFDFGGFDSCPWEHRSSDRLLCGQTDAPIRKLAFPGSGVRLVCRGPPTFVRHGSPDPADAATEGLPPRPGIDPKAPAMERKLIGLSAEMTCNPRSGFYTENCPEPRSTRQGRSSGLSDVFRGSSSGVEHHVANVVVEGSNPFSRSVCRQSGLAASLKRVGCVMAVQAVPTDVLRGNVRDEQRRSRIG